MMPSRKAFERWMYNQVDRRMERTPGLSIADAYQHALHVWETAFLVPPIPDPRKRPQRRAYPRTRPDRPEPIPAPVKQSWPKRNGPVPPIIRDLKYRN